MQEGQLRLVGAFALLALYGCSGSDQPPTAESGGSGGATASAGSSALGGAGSSGGGAGGTQLGGAGSSAGGTANGGSGGSNGSGGRDAEAGAAGSAGESGLGEGIACTEPFDAEGSDLSGCIATVSGVTIKFFPLEPQVRVKRVAVYLHGDGAVDWEGFYPFLAETVEWCKARDILVVAPLSPVAYEGDPPDQRSFGAAFPEDAAKVGTALDTFLDAYAVPHAGLLYWSMSGGSWFVTSSFLPMFGARLPGAYALSCGASEFWRDYTWDIKGPARAQNKLLFNYGTEDFLRPGEEASADKFERDGFSVAVKTYPGAEHCDHLIHEPTTEFWLGSL